MTPFSSIRTRLSKILYIVTSLMTAYAACVGSRPGVGSSVIPMVTESFICAWAANGTRAVVAKAAAMSNFFMVVSLKRPAGGLVLYLPATPVRRAVGKTIAPETVNRTGKGVD